MGGHDYKNYAHLEGVIVEDPVVLKVPGGVNLSFTLSVKESGANRRTHFNVEVGKDNSKFAISLKKDTSVWIDGKIRIRRNPSPGGCDAYAIYAHRIYAIDYISGKLGAAANPAGQEGHDFKNHVHLEGIVEEEPIASKIQGQGRLLFTLSVKETKHGSDGKAEKELSFFNVEVGGNISPLKKSTPVWIDGKIEIRRIDGCDAYIVVAHRINAIDFSAGKRPGDLGPPMLVNGF